MRGRVLAVSSFALLLPISLVSGDPISQVNQIVAFGDSLTDTGNASIYASEHGMPGAIPGPGYAYRNVLGVPFPVGEYTNPPALGGPSGLWIDQFAADAGLPDQQPFLAGTGGTNFAVGSAETGSSFGDVGYQLGVYLTGRTSTSSASLYSFWAGANDIIAGNNPVTAADNLEADIATLAGDGGKYFLWFNLPLLGETPRGKSSGDSALLNLASVAFDTEWTKDMTSLDKTYPGIVLVGVNIEALFNQILNTPGHDGLNIGSTPPGGNPNDYLFTSDGLHPTSAADALIADFALADFEAAIKPATIPEPANVALVLVGFGLVLAFRSRSKPKDRS